MTDAVAALLQRGSRAADGGLLNLAATIYREALVADYGRARDENIAAALCGLGHVARLRHDPRRAVAYAQEALAHDLGSTEAMKLMVEALESLGDPAAKSWEVENGSARPPLAATPSATTWSRFRPGLLRVWRVIR